MGITHIHLVIFRYFSHLIRKPASIVLYNQENLILIGDEGNEKYTHFFKIILYSLFKQYLLLTAIIIIALSKSPNPINGTALWKATVRINYKIWKILQNIHVFKKYSPSKHQLWSL